MPSEPKDVFQKTRNVRCCFHLPLMTPYLKMSWWGRNLSLLTDWLNTTNHKKHSPTDPIIFTRCSSSDYFNNTLFAFFHSDRMPKKVWFLPKSTPSSDGMTALCLSAAM